MEDRHPQRRRSSRGRGRARVGVGRLIREVPREGGTDDTAALHSTSAHRSNSAPARPTPTPDPRSAAGPVRTCIGCRSRSVVDGLLRVVVVDGVLTPDPRRRLPGRGAWLHPASECLDRAERRSAFPRALRVPGPLDTGAVRARIERGGRSEHVNDSVQMGSTASGARERPGSVTRGSKVDPS
ncbi:MAG TPA: YlxR family protein [Pseudonocardia sp.]